MADDVAQRIMPPAAVHAIADHSPSSPQGILQVVGKQPESAKNRPSRALLLVDSPRPAPSSASQPSYVRPAGGGLLDSWFSGQASKTAKKEHEDGRRATALPPPDASAVDWNGVPFHQPKRAENRATTSPAPLRDAQRTPAPVPTSSANLRRPTTASPSAQRSVTGNPVSSRPTSSLHRTGSGLLSDGSLKALSRSPIAAKPSAPTAASTRSGASELSSVKSSRRSDRRASDPMASEADVEPAEEGARDVAQTPTASIAMTERLPAPSVPRRELTAVEPSVSALPRPQSTASGKQDLAPSASPEETLPMLPPPVAETTPVADVTRGAVPHVALPIKSDATLEDNWKSIGSGVRQPTPQAAAMGLANSPAAALPTVPTPPIVKDATPSGPSPASERVLREQLFTASEVAATRPDVASNRAGGGVTPAETKPGNAGKSQPTSNRLAASELPGVLVITEGPSEIMIHSLTQYEVRVENRGATDATGIAVRSSLPAWAQVQGHNASIGSIKTVDQGGQPQLLWTIDKLPAGVVERLFVRVKAVKSGVFDAATDWSMMPQKHVAKVTVREPKLVVVIDGPDEIIYGRSEKYRVRVTNPGDGDASNVMFTLSPDSKTPQSQNIGQIPAGKEAEFEIELTARERGELKIGGVAVADHDVKSIANKSIRIAAADIEAELTGPPLRYQNSEAKYHLHVTNTGKANCESIAAELRLPAGVKYVSGIQPSSVQGDRLTWKIDALQPGAVREYDILCKLDRTGDMMLTFSCTGTAAGRANVAIETRVEAIADLALSISDPVAPAPVNAEVQYEMTIHNRGSKAAEDVRVVAQFSNGIEPVRVEGHTGEVATGQALFSPISRIEPGSSVRLKVTAKADRAGDHRFRAEVRHAETSLVAEEATMFMDSPAERISRRSTDR